MTTDSEGNTTLKPIIDYLVRADETAKKLGVEDRFKPAYHQFLLQMLAIGYIKTFGNDLKRPAWVPYMPAYLPWGSPNSDDIYRCCPVDAAGTYRLSGTVGTSHFNFITLKKGGAHLGLISSGKTLSEFDLNKLPTDADGIFSIIVSPTRPEGYDGLWHPLDPETTQFMYRARTTRIDQTDTTCEIERLDCEPGSQFPTHEDVDAQVQALSDYAQRQVDFLIGYQDDILRRGGGEVFIPDDQSGYGALVEQRYLLHKFDLAEDEALILDSELPDSVEYWSVHLFDTLFNSLDNRSHQTFLNGEQVDIDSDGRVRIVVSAKDPGVRNWLDMAGWPHAGLHWRWNTATSCPIPQVTRVKLSELSSVLPAETKRVSAEERLASDSLRSRHYQKRLV